MIIEYSVSNLFAPKPHPLLKEGDSALHNQETFAT
jgi:hypothetical protein